MKHFDFVYLTGLDEEMILTGMATRRSSLTLTSECIKAATTTDSRIGFQISIPERGVAFQHRLPNSPTRTTGACCFVKESGPFVTFKNNLTVLLLEGGGRQIKCKCLHKCKWRVYSKAVAAFDVELVSSILVYEWDGYFKFVFLGFFFWSYAQFLQQQRLATKTKVFCRYLLSPHGGAIISHTTHLSHCIAAGGRSFTMISVVLW